MRKGLQPHTPHTYKAPPNPCLVKVHSGSLRSTGTRKDSLGELPPCHPHPSPSLPSQEQPLPPCTNFLTLLIFALAIPSTWNALRPSSAFKLQAQTSALLENFADTPDSPLGFPLGRAHTSVVPMGISGQKAHNVMERDSVQNTGRWKNGWERG